VTNIARRFFTMEAFSRYKVQWSASCAASAAIVDLSVMARTSFPYDEAKRLMRIMIAAHVAGIVGLGDSAYGDFNFFDRLDKIYKLLTPAEMARIREIGVNRAAHWELLSWCARSHPPSPSALRSVTRCLSSSTLGGRVQGDGDNSVRAGQQVHGPSARK
jgi:hypothetical protein